MNKVLIIAEAGVNHNGSLENAFKLIDAAVDAGVDYVKFQTFKSENLVSKSAKKADYQIQNTGNSTDSQYEVLKKLELSHENHELLIDYCKQKKIQFFSTAFDLDSLAYLKEIGLDLVKIPSGEITNLPYLRKAAQLFNKVILSTGMCTMEDIEAAINVFLAEKISKENITILHCNTEYPTPMNDVNLTAMLSIQQEFGTDIGYSDHTLGIEVPVAAVALGASVIEKHFTLDNTMEGPDHAASLEPNQLKDMVKAIRNIEKAMSGNGIKQPSESEKKNMYHARKSIYLNKDILRNNVIKEEDLVMKRPGNGISPMDIEKIVGKKVVEDLKSDHLLSWENIK